MGELRRLWSGEGVRLSVIFALACFVRLMILNQPIASLDRIFLPDDVYYSLSIARHIAAGFGPSADGIRLTNGFQPLITFLQALIFLAHVDGDAAVRAAMIISGVFGACAAVMLAYLVGRLGGARAGLIAGILAALCPAIIRNDLNGLETSLAGLLCLILIAASPGRRQAYSWRRCLCLGGLTALALLARIDSCFVVIACGLFLWRQSGVRKCLVIGTTAAVLMLPWWVYSYHIVGTPLPESGAAVRQIVLYHLQTDLNPLSVAYMALGTVGRLLPLPLSRSLAEVIIGCALLLALAAPLFRGLPALKDGVGLTALIAAALLQFLFYTLYLPAIWFLARYFQFFDLAVLGVISMEAARRSATRSTVQKVTVALVVTALYVPVYELFFSAPRAAVASGFEGAKGYRDVAMEIIRHVPDGAVLGAMQSGALSYYAPPGTRVVNLDGVVNRSAYLALRDKHVAAYARNAGVTHFADWDLNLDFFRARSAPDGELPNFMRVAQARPQGRDQTTLYRLDWPAAQP